MIRARLGHSSIVPVLDIARGSVVHAKGGDRSRYTAMQSSLCDGDCPVQIAQAITSAVGSRLAYVADLGAFEGRSRDWTTLARLGDFCCTADILLMIDFGIINAIDALSAFELLEQATHANFALIIASESMEEMNELCIVADQYAERLLMSFDLRDGEIVVADRGFQQRRLVEMAEFVATQGIDQFILLDTNDVGSSRGATQVDRIRQLRSALPDALLLSGGGIRGREDAEVLQEAGCDGVLVATAIHAGQF